MLENYNNISADGFLERKHNGAYKGIIVIDGVKMDGLEGVYFEDGGKTHLWIKRTPVLEYNPTTQTYIQRPREPRWEAYLTKQSDGVAAYKGEFSFLHFRYSIVGVWDSNLGIEKQRLNFYVERLPSSKQTIINKINQKNRNKK